MASSPFVTYSKKKRSFLPSIASRNRLLDTVGEETCHPVHAPSKHTDPIDEMASALLDSTLDEQRLPSPTEQIYHGTSSELPQNRARPNRVEKSSSPSFPRRSSKRHGKGHGMSPQRSSPGGLIRPLPKSKTFANPLSQHPTTKLPPSTTVNLESHLLTAGNGQQYVDINKKMEMMMAATKALKPATVEEGNSRVGPSPSLMSRFRSNKVIEKMTKAFLPKTSNFDKGNNARGRGSASANSGHSDLTSLALHQLKLPPSQLSKKELPVASLELRVNEGQNLNRKKVQQMTGGHIPRKPLPDDGKSFKSRKSSEDPFSELLQITRTPNSFERRLRNSKQSDESVIPPLPSSDPFESENVFDSSLNAMLASSPLASSTPRATRRHIRCLSDTPVKKPGRIAVQWIGRPMSTSPHGELCDGDCSSEIDLISPNAEVAVKCNCSKENPSPSKNHSALLSGCFGPFPDLSHPTTRGNASPAAKAKKHPSPTKDQLQTLSKRMTNYGIPEDLRTDNVSFKIHRSLTKADLMGSERKLMLASSTPLVEIDSNASPRSDLFMQQSPTKRELKRVRADSALRLRLLRPDSYRIPPRSSKKHPSPSMHDLEVLDHQFRRYQGAGMGDPKDVDELATSFYAGMSGSKTASALSVYSHNHKASVRPSRERPFSELAPYPERKPTRHHSALPKAATHSRLPLPVEKPTRSRPDLRLAVQFHPIRLDSSEIDELQWDATQYCIGQAAAVH